MSFCAQSHTQELAALAGAGKRPTSKGLINQGEVMKIGED
jgi:hypothetical protein